MKNPGVRKKDEEPKAHLHKSACLDGWFLVDGLRLTVKLPAGCRKYLEIGDLAVIRDFDRDRYQDCVAELVRYEYVGTSVGKFSFRRVKLIR